MPFIFNLNNCQPRKPTNICIPTRPLSSQIWTFPWSFIYSNPSVNFNAIWMIKSIDRPGACACQECGFFFLLGKQTLPTDKRGHGKNGQGRRWCVEELTSWTGRVCYTLFCVCIAEKIIWFSSKWSIWIYGQPEKKCSHAQGIFFARMEVFTLCFVLSMVLRLDAEHIENKTNVGRRRVY